MKAANLTTDVLKIFDQVEVDAMYGRVNGKFSKIIDDIKASMYKTVPQSDRILIDNVFNLDVDKIRQILGDKYDPAQLGVYAEFIAACRKEANKRSIISSEEQKTGRKRKYIKYYKDGKPVYFTGDGANYDKDGYITITGRTDDVINVSGHMTNIGSPFYWQPKNTLIWELDVNNHGVIEKWWVRPGLFYDDHIKSE